ncbi:MAG: FAD-binding oxidoreductase [Bacteriovoracia bacterium]
MSKPILPWNTLQLDGELSLLEQDRISHSEDASVHRLVPAAVAYPRTKRDLERILAFCRLHSLPLHGWGAGTSRGGQPLGNGLTVDFRKYFHHILGFDEASQELTVESGALYSEVQKYLRARGRSFPPDPSYHQCTIGGMVANNAAGIHSVKYGGTASYIAAMEFLTSDGAWHQSDQPDALTEKVQVFLKKNSFSDYPAVEKNSAGYALNRGLSAQGYLDLAQLLTGSEGTLGLFTEIRLRTVPLPTASSLGILYFESLESACRAAMDLRSYEISACELVDKVLLDLHAAATSEPKHAKKISGNTFLDLFYEKKAEAILVVEIEGGSTSAAEKTLRQALGSVTSLDSRIAQSPKESALIWDLRRHTSPILNRLENGKITIKPLWAVEDVSLPKENFLPYLTAQKALFTKHGLTCSFFGHAASCNLHIDPIGIDPRLALQNEELAALFDLVAEESYELVVRFGGSISGEHGDGIARTPFLKLQYPSSHRLFGPFKALFDPSGILNPGKIVEVPHA